MEIDLKFLTEFLNNIGKLLGNKCEIVIHDFTKGFESTIVHIVNGSLSGRTVGGCPTNLFFEEYQEISKREKDFSVYFSRTNDGRIIKSSTTFLFDKENNLVGAICINIDVTEIAEIQNLFGEILYDPSESESNRLGNEKFVKNVQELMDHYLMEVEQKIGKPAGDMNKQEKLRALSYLNERGILQISKSNVKLCDFFKISKFTLYNYLDEIRNNTEKNSEDE